MQEFTKRFIFVMLVMALLIPGQVFAKDKRIVVGGKNFTEQYLLSELAAVLLTEAGFEVDLKTGVGSVIARKSLENGQFDLYYEYTGSAYTVYYKQKDMAIMTDPVRIYEWVKAADAKKGLVWIEPVKFNDTYTLMMKKTQADELGIVTISDLGAYVNQHPDELIFALDTEFWERPDGFKKVMQTYGFRLPAKQVKKMSLGLTYKALKDGLVNSAMGFSTDGRIAAFGFVNLVDDKAFFPVYNPVPVVRQEVLEAHPEIREILKPLAIYLTNEEMQMLNAAVDVEHKQVGDAARQWLREKKLIK